MLLHIAICCYIPLNVVTCSHMLLEVVAYSLHVVANHCVLLQVGNWHHDHAVWLLSLNAQSIVLAVPTVCCERKRS